LALVLPAKNIGKWSKPLETEVTWRDTMNFAASVADNNPWYFDDTREEGILAPPMLATAMTWPIFVNRHEYWGMDDWPEEVVARQVHYTEAILMHRPLRPGDVVRMRAQILGVEPARGGALTTVLFEGTDLDGAPVFSEYAGAFYRGVRCPDDASFAGEKYVPPTMPDVEAPEWEVPIAIDPLAAHIYDGCTGLSFPIHTSKRFARSVRLPDPILQGTATLAIAIRELINREAGADPALLKVLNCKFTAMVAPGTDITVRLLSKATDEDGTDLFYDVLNHKGQTALSEGYVRIAKGRG
jgi:acyl dehydratase